MVNKVHSLEEAVNLIKDGDFVASSGFALTVLADEVFKGIEDKFLASGEPNRLTWMHAAGQTDFGSGGGMQRLAHEGLIKRLIAGHVGANPGIVKLINENKMECYNLPQGVIMHQYRNIAGGKPGEITKIGLKTFIDPRLEGAKLNTAAKEDIVKVLEIEGEEYLFYPAPKINIGIIRGTSADEFGNVTIEEESFSSEILNLAIAAKASGGKVIVQVKNLLQGGSIPASRVAVPGNFVDAIVVSKEPYLYHKQTPGEFYNSVIAGHKKVPQTSLKSIPLDERKVVGRRAAMELVPNAVVNLGIGMPEAVSPVAAEEGIGDQLILTIESGIIGGMPAGGKNFGAAINAWGMVDGATQFDFYNGGGLDITFLGLAESNAKGDVNVSKFGPKIAGAGGFIDISQATRKVVFCGTFTAGGLKLEVKDGKLAILQEGRAKKFKNSLDQITFSGEFAMQSGQEVLYITERAVLKLTGDGLMVTEIAPGIDLDKDVLGQMEFKPLVAEDLKIMDPKIFSEGIVGIKEIVTGEVSV
jgi:propionate CoA-transferase